MNPIWSAPLFAMLVTTSAFAKDGDEEACAGLDVGDACTRADGDPGTCQEDTSDPGVITCDDDTPTGGASGSDTDGSSSGGGCDVGGAPAGVLVGLLAAVALRRRSTRA